MVGFFHFFLCDNKEDNTTSSSNFLLLFVFFSFYYFLWMISAFGVVWYGILMYGALFTLFTLAYYQLTEVRGKYTQKEKNKMLSLSFLVFCIPAFFLLYSGIPYFLNTTKNAGAVEYKLGKYSENKSLFLSHSDYLPILFALNIDDTKKSDFLTLYKTQLLQILSKYSLSEDIQGTVANISSVEYIENFISQLLALDGTKDNNVL